MIALDRHAFEGLPLAYEVLPGNTADSKTLRTFLSKIEKAIRQGAARLGDGSRRAPPRRFWRRMRASDPPVQYLVGTPKGRLNRLEKHLIREALAEGEVGGERRRSNCWPRTTSSMSSPRAPIASPRNARCGGGS